MGQNFNIFQDENKEPVLEIVKEKEDEVFSNIFKEKQNYRSYLREERDKHGIISNYEDDIFEREDSPLPGASDDPMRLFRDRADSEKTFRDMSVKKKLSKLLDTANKHRH